MLNDVVAESVGKDFSGKWRNGDARGLALENVAEVFKVAISAADRGGFELEGGDVGAADDFVGRVHVAANPVSLGISNLDSSANHGELQALVTSTAKKTARRRWKATSEVEDGLLQSPENSQAGRRSPRTSADERLVVPASWKMAKCIHGREMVTTFSKFHVVCFHVGHELNTCHDYSISCPKCLLTEVV